MCVCVSMCTVVFANVVLHESWVNLFHELHSKIILCACVCEHGLSSYGFPRSVINVQKQCLNCLPAFVPQ